MARERFNARQWSDDELRAAVAGSRSWRQVAVRLGLKSNSTNNIRRRALQLGVDYSHFVGRRRWSTELLRASIADACSWAELLSSLGMDQEDRAGQAKVKADAARLGIGLGHLGRAVEPTAPWPGFRADISMLASAAEPIAAAWFGVRGIAVALPDEPKPYDLLVEMPDGIARVQVKSTRSRVGGSWQVIVGQRPYSRDKSAARRGYDPEDVDYFVVVTADGDVFLIPASVLGGRARIHLSAYAEYRVGSAASLLAPAVVNTPVDPAPGHPAPATSESGVREPEVAQTFPG